MKFIGVYVGDRLDRIYFEYSNCIYVYWCKVLYNNPRKSGFYNMKDAIDAFNTYNYRSTELTELHLILMGLSERVLLEKLGEI